MGNNFSLVTLAFSVLAALFAGVGFWSFVTALLTKRVDTRTKDTNALVLLEQESRNFREEVREELASAKKEIEEMKQVFIPLIDTLDEFLPKMLHALTEDESLLIHQRVNAAKFKT